MTRVARLALAEYFRAQLAQRTLPGRAGAEVLEPLGAGGMGEVYIQRFPEGGGRLQVSGGGACQMRWGRNGEIFYAKLATEGGAAAPTIGVGTLVGVPVTTAPELSVGRPRSLFESTGLGGA